MKRIEEFIVDSCPNMSDETLALIIPLVVASVLAQLIFEVCEEVGFDDRGNCFVG